MSQFRCKIFPDLCQCIHSRERLLSEIWEWFDGGALVEDLLVQRADLDVLEVLQLGPRRPRAAHLLRPLVQLAGQLLHRLLAPPDMVNDSDFIY